MLNSFLSSNIITKIQKKKDVTREKYVGYNVFK
jgi:hypothetical protein